MTIIELNAVNPNFPDRKIPIGATSIRITDCVSSEGYSPQCIVHVSSKTAQAIFRFTSSKPGALLSRKEEQFYIKGYEIYSIQVDPAAGKEQTISFEFEFLGFQYQANGLTVEKTNEHFISNEVGDILMQAVNSGESITVTTMFQGDQPWMHVYSGKAYQILSLHYQDKVYSRALFIPLPQAQDNDVEPYEILVKSITGVPVKLQPEGVDLVSIHTEVWIINEK